VKEEGKRGSTKIHDGWGKWADKGKRRERGVDALPLGRKKYGLKERKTIVHSQSHRQKRSWRMLKALAVDRGVTEDIRMQTSWSGERFNQPKK